MAETIELRFRDKVLLRQGLRLSEPDERREILRRSIAENLSCDGRAKVYVFATGHFMFVSPDEAMVLIERNEASLASIYGTSQSRGVQVPGPIGPDESVVARTAGVLVTIMERNRVLPFAEDEMIGLFRQQFPDAQRPRVRELHAAVTYLRQKRQIVGTPRGWVLADRKARCKVRQPEGG